MSSRLLGGAVLVLLGLAYVTPALADDGFLHSVVRDIKRRNCWPQPFVGPDRQAVREPFAIQVANGWQQQNLLGDHYFEGPGSQLTEAGKLKVQSIMNEAPEQHRAVFVHRGATLEETAARVATVQQHLAQSAYPGTPMVPVLETTRVEDGWPAERVDAVSRKFLVAMPDPKLPSVQGGSSGGGSGTTTK